MHYKNNDLLTLDEAAIVTQVSRSFLFKLCKQGRIPYKEVKVTYMDPSEHIVARDLWKHFPRIKPKKLNEWLTLAEAGKLLDKSEREVRELCEKKKIHIVKSQITTRSTIRKVIKVRWKDLKELFPYIS